MKILRGTVQSGRREAAKFLAVPWVACQLKEAFDLTPFPGTLNLRLDDPASRALWAELLATGGGAQLIPPPDSDNCPAACYPVSISGGTAGVIVRPQVEGYPGDVVEVLAAVNLRERLGLSDGDECRLFVLGSEAPRYQCVLFDLEGTIVDFQWQLGPAEAALREAVGKMGFETSLFVADNYAGIRRRALGMADSPEKCQEIGRRLAPIYDHYDLDALSRWSIRDGARQLFNNLRSLGVKLGLVSNIGRKAVEGALKKFDMTEVFSMVVTRNDVTNMKPDGEGIRKILGEFRVSAEKALMVGDSLSDLFAARDAEVEVAIIAGGESSPDEVAASGPDHQLDELLEVRKLL